MRLSRANVVLGTIAGLCAVALAVVPAPTPAAGVDASLPGQAGFDISLPLTDSAVTVSGRDEFSRMEFTINQTEDLTNQAISLSWTGGVPSTRLGLVRFGGNFVQVMQCWGEPDGAVPENPGPPPEQCVWGATDSSGPKRGFATGHVTGRNFSNVDFPDYDPTVGTVDESGDVYRDFVAVDGTVVSDHVDRSASGPLAQYWLNTFFNNISSNELSGARTLGDGDGQALFTVNTGVETSALGCGQRVQPAADGGLQVPRCWLVIVPRADAATENEGLERNFPPSQGVGTSPMLPRVWENRIAVELDFTPVDSPCDIAADQRRISGTEISTGAVSSWQPVLCTQPGLLPYSYGVVSDQLARRQLLTDTEGAPGMVVVNRPLDEGTTNAEDPVLYAPLTASATTIGFYVERVRFSGTPDDAGPFAGLRYETINLTPRLVAKLLTQSYRSQVEIRSSSPCREVTDDAGTTTCVPYEWEDDNPISMLSDPDFLRFNPEFALWIAGSAKHAGGMVLPAGTSDLARQLWEWIFADPEAMAWLDGEPDEWGMVVNPQYATTAEGNPTGFPFGSPTPDGFPKSDPYCFQAATLQPQNVTPPELCGLDWFPYASNYEGAAKLTSQTRDGSKTTLNRFAGRVTDVWQRSAPQSLGRRTMFGLTDLPSTSRFGLQTASLSRAGDNADDREFVAPDDGGMRTALGSMASVDGMLQLDPSATRPGAYPLTAVSYAAIRPLALDAEEREDFAAFLDYAAGPGQVRGFELGQLPVGYFPLPAALTSVTASVAEQVRTLQPPAEPAPTPAPTGPTNAGPVSQPPPPAPAPPSSPSASGGSGGSGGVAADSVDEDETTPEEGEVAAPTPTAPSTDRLTPVASVGNGRFAAVVFAAVALVAGLAVLEITKGRPRRRRSSPDTPVESTGP